MAEPGPGEIWLSEGLVGQDERLDELFALFEQLQLATVDAANPALDLLTFAQSAFYFAVIMKKRSRPQVQQPPQQEAPPPVPTRKQRKLQREAEAAKAAIAQAFAQVTHENDEHYGSRPLFPAEPPAPGPSGSLNAWETYIASLDAPPPLEESHFPATTWHDTDIPPNVDLHSTTDTVDHVAWWDGSGPVPPPELPNVPDQEEAIGLLYLTPPTYIGDPLHLDELSLGLVLAPAHRGAGHAQRAVTLALDRTFSTHKCHRVQAVLLDHVARDRAVCLFTSLQFAHEGVRRRAFFSPLEAEYKDVTYMGILDTDWVLRGRARRGRLGKAAPRSVWDEMFARHQREREELLNWESGLPLRRSASVATIRPGAGMDVDEVAVEAEEEDDEEGEEGIYGPMKDEDKGAKWKGKGKEGEVEVKREAFDMDVEGPPDSESETESEGYFSSTSSRVSRESSSASWDKLDMLSDSDSESDLESTASFDVLSASDSESEAEGITFGRRAV